MSRFHAYLTSAVKVIETHGKGEPLAIHLKRFFSADKKFGSRDRKIISTLCYDYYRLGNAFPGEAIEKRILSGLYLCENNDPELLPFFSVDQVGSLHLPTSEKLSILELFPQDIFQYTAELSAEIK